MKQIFICPLDWRHFRTRIFKFSLFLTLSCLAFGKCIRVWVPPRQYAIDCVALERNKQFPGFTVLWGIWQMFSKLKCKGRLYHYTKSVICWFLHFFPVLFSCWYYLSYEYSENNLWLTKIKRISPVQLYRK